LMMRVLLLAALCACTLAFEENETMQRDELKGEPVTSTLKTGNKQAQALHFMAKTSAFLQKVLGGDYKAEMQALLSAGKADKKYARLRTPVPTRCDQAKSDFMKILSPSFCALTNQLTSESEQRNLCGPEDMANSVGQDGVSAGCFGYINNLSESYTACHGVTAAEGVTATCKMELGIPCAAAAEDCTYHTWVAAVSGFGKCSATQDDYDASSPNCVYTQQCNNTKFCVKASDAVMQTNMAKICSFEGDSTSTSCGKDSFLAHMVRMSRDYAAGGLDDCQLGDNSGAQENMGSLMKRLGSIVENLCIKDGTTMCYPKFAKMISSGLFNISGTPTEVEMTAVCDTCSLKMHKSIVRMMMFTTYEEGADDGNLGKAASMFDLYCAQDLDENYCTVNPANAQLYVDRKECPTVADADGYYYKSSSSGYLQLSNGIGVWLYGGWNGLRPNFSIRKVVGECNNFHLCFPDHADGGTAANGCFEVSISDDKLTLSNGWIKDNGIRNSLPLNVMCSVCGMKTMQAMNMFDDGESSKEIEGHLKSMCYKKDNVYCGDYISGVVDSAPWNNMIKNCAAPVDRPRPNGISCSDNCKTSMTDFASQWGCCAQTLVIGHGDEFSAYLLTQAFTCGVSLVAPCRGGDPLEITIDVANLKCEWVMNNTAMVANIVAAHIAIHSGAIKSQVTVTATCMDDNSGGTNLNTKVEFPSQRHSDAVQALFMARRTSSQDLSLYTLDMLSPSAKIDSLALMQPQIRLLSSIFCKDASAVTACNSEVRTSAVIESDECFKAAGLYASELTACSSVKTKGDITPECKMALGGTANCFGAAPAEFSPDVCLNNGALAFATESGRDMCIPQSIYPSPEVEHCVFGKTWRDVLGSRALFATGGLGKRLCPEWEVWVCAAAHPCVEREDDWTCFTYSERHKVFVPWGLNSALHVMRNTSSRLDGVKATHETALV